MRGRRSFLEVGCASLLVGLAGCASGDGSERGPSDGGTEAGAAGTTRSAAGSDQAPPGADVLGGPDDLRSDPTVGALALDADRGAGRYVFSPAVAWVEAGATVSWSVEGASHSVTAYHPDVGGPRRIPEGATPFDSGTLPAGETYEHAFETPGVYDYRCRPHESRGMVGLVVVEGVRGGPGATEPAELGETPAASLSRLLEAAGIVSDDATAGGTETSGGTTTAGEDTYNPYDADASGVPR